LHFEARQVRQDAVEIVENFAREFQTGHALFRA
jgi:hypothetical protein